MRFLTVLLAEDEPVISLEIRHILEEKGLQVIEATEAQAISEACEQYQPDLVLLNFKKRSQGDGMALAKALKKRFESSFLFVTGARPQDMAASKDFETGFHILYKPFTPGQLWQTVELSLHPNLLP